MANQILLFFRNLFLYYLTLCTYWVFIFLPFFVVLKTEPTAFALSYISALVLVLDRMLLRHSAALAAPEPAALLPQPPVELEL